MKFIPISSISFWNTTFIILLLSVATNATEQSQTQTNILFEDSLKESLKPGWRWIREDPETHRISDEGLRIKVEPGGLMGNAANAKNILVRSLPDSADRIQVTVETHHQSQYEQAGLILYTDDNNYVKLVQEHVNDKTGVVLVVEINAQARVISNIPSPWAKTRLLLKIKKNNQFSAYAAKAHMEGGVSAKQPGTEELTFIGQFEFPRSETTRIGVFTQSGEPGADRWATFTNFAIHEEE